MCKRDKLLNVYNGNFPSVFFKTVIGSKKILFLISKSERIKLNVYLYFINGSLLYPLWGFRKKSNYRRAGEEGGERG